MFKTKNEYAINNQEILTQSYIYVSNSIENIMQSSNIKSLAVTSSLPIKNEKLYACRNICRELGRNGKSVLLINADIIPGQAVSISDIALKQNYKEVSCTNINKKEFESLINKHQNDFDSIIINIPPVSIMADSLEYASSCGNVILLERYLYSKYSRYENTILMLKQSNVNICGVVTYR